GPDFLTVYHPLTVLQNRAGLQRSQIRSSLRLAIAHPVHGLPAKNFRKVFCLLPGRAKHNQRIRLNTCAYPWRIYPFEFFQQRELLMHRSTLPPQMLGPGKPDPAGCAKSLRKLRVELPLFKTLLVENLAAMRSPVA